MIVGISAGQQECQDVKGGTLCQIPVWTKLPPAGRQPWGISMVHDVAVITKVTVSKRRGGTHAAVQVQLCAGHRLIATESFDLANCDTVELAQDAAAVFVVGWANDLRNAAQQQVGSVIKDVEITADGKGPGAAEVKLPPIIPTLRRRRTHLPWRYGPSHRSQQRRRRRSVSFTTFSLKPPISANPRRGLLFTGSGIS